MTERLNLSELSYPAYAYITLGSIIRLADNGTAESLKATRLQMLNLMTDSQKAEIIQVGQWWQEQIKKVT